MVEEMKQLKSIYDGASKKIKSWILWEIEQEAQKIKAISAGKGEEKKQKG